MDNVEVIKNLLKDFQNVINISLQFNKENVKIVFSFNKWCEELKNIESYDKITYEGDLYVTVTSERLFNKGKVNIRGYYFLSKIHEIETIEETVFYNTKKALELFLEDI